MTGYSHILGIINNAVINMVCIYFFKILFSSPSGLYPGTEFLDHVVALFSIFEAPPCCFLWRLDYLTFSAIGYKDYLFNTSLPAFTASYLLDDNILIGVSWLYYILTIIKICIHNTYCCLIAKSCPTLYYPIDCAHQASLSMRFFQARILEWIAISFSLGSSQLKDLNHLCCIDRILCCWTIREVNTSIKTNWSNH